MRNYLPRSLRNAARTIHSRQPGGMLYDERIRSRTANRVQYAQP
jgi:hypothetical protein